jgi:hypothetical protein
MLYKHCISSQKFIGLSNYNQKEFEGLKVTVYHAYSVLKMNPFRRFWAWITSIVGNTFITRGMGLTNVNNVVLQTPAQQTGRDGASISND